jgi:hypothetical protein
MGQQSYPPGMNQGIPPMMSPYAQRMGMQGKFAQPTPPSRANIQPIPTQQQEISRPIQYMMNQRKG